MNLLEVTGYRCPLSGLKLTLETASLDHIVPLSKGGEHVMGNVQIVHVVVNSMKGVMTVEEFVYFCKQVSKHAQTLGSS